MAIAALTGHGDPDVLRLLPATLDPGRVALVGLHAWSEDEFPNIARWGISSFRPDELHRSSQPLLDWLEASGCSRVLMLSSTPRARFTYPGMQSDTPPPLCFPVLSGAGPSGERETKTAKMGHFILVCAWLGKVCCSPWTRARGACFTTLAPPDSLFLLVGTVTVVRKICLYS